MKIFIKPKWANNLSIRVLRKFDFILGLNLTYFHKNDSNKPIYNTIKHSLEGLSTSKTKG